MLLHFSEGDPIMDLEYFSDEEYQRAFIDFGGVRDEIARLLCHSLGMNAGIILDIPAGHGYLSFEVAKRFKQSRVLGVGLPNDCTAYLRIRNQNEFSPFYDRVDFVACDATRLALPADSCDLIVNFLGLEDIMMTRGETGVLQTLSEFARVLRAGAILELTIAEYGDTPEEEIAKSVWESIGLNAVFQPANFYSDMLNELDFKLIKKRKMLYPKKMKANQAREEIEFACLNAPKIYKSFGVNSVSFDEIWSEFGSLIETHGMAYYPKLWILIFQKT
jgi:ubiquinone/menaquinone biosynthesis C-methylase UbiE